jgi:ubiquinone/menaquinone biosynthesis C-methylase UbiE
MNPPFKKSIFDFVFSSGVLHHTPNTKKSFLGLSKLVKKGGRYWVWLYLVLKHVKCENWAYDNVFKLYVYEYISKIISRLPGKMQNFILYCLVPPFLIKQELEVRAGIKKGRAKWKEKLIDLHDNFSPRYNHRHTPEEVIEWFKEIRFTNITISDTREKYGFGIFGDKTSE